MVMLTNSFLDGTPNFMQKPNLSFQYFATSSCSHTNSFNKSAAAGPNSVSNFGAFTYANLPVTA